MRHSMVPAAALVCASLFSTAAIAGDIQGLVGIYGEENARGYMQPLADALGANMNSGFYNDARVPVSGFHLCVGVSTMLAPVAKEAKTFLATTESDFNLANPASSVEAPTIFGDSNGPSVAGTGGTAFVFPGGLSTRRLPLAVPQVTIGSFHGTEAAVRFVDIEVNDSIKKISLFGVGVRHNLNQYLPALPFDLAAGGFWQSFELQDFIKARTLSLGLQASLGRGPAELTGGLAYETARLDLDYPRGSAGAGNVSFSLDGANSIRLTVGGTLSLAILKLHADYSLASQGVVTVGLGLGR